MYKTKIWIYSPETDTDIEVEVLVKYHFDRDERDGPCYFNLDGLFYADTKEPIDYDILDIESVGDDLEDEIRKYLDDYYANDFDIPDDY